MAQFSRFHFPLIPFQILLSVSLFSLLVLSSSFLLYLMRFICFKSDRKYIFLACNGILVFLIRNSGLTHLPTPLLEISSTNYEHVSQETVHDQQPEPKLVEKSDIEVQVEQGRDGKDLVTGRTDGNGVMSIEEDDTMTQEEDDKTFVIREEEEEETSLLSAKELNKMCDDFIKKMRRGIHIEVQ